MSTQTKSTRQHPTGLSEGGFNYLTQAIKSCQLDEYFYARLDTVIRFENRLALYLPFLIMRQAPQFFREAYMYAWQNCLKKIDRRDDFTVGVSDEVVIKAAHLLPWLIETGMMQRTEIMRRFGYAKKNSLLYHNLAETAPILLHRGYITQEQYEKICENNAQAMEELSRNPIEAPIYHPKSERIVRRSEREIIQDHLLKDYFPRKHDKLSIETRDYPTINGDSAFYDDRFREIAASLMILAVSYV